MLSLIIRRSSFALLGSLLVGSAAARQPLIDLTKAGDLQRLEKTSDQVGLTPDDRGLQVDIAAGDEGYPGVRIRPPGECWDLSGFGHVEARIANLGDKAMSVSLRVDNPGDWRDNPWNTESATIKAGETGTVKVIFGYQYGMKKGFALDPAKVCMAMVFTEKAKHAKSLRIESIIAAGRPGEKPPVPPEEVRIAPRDGYLLGGGGIEIDLEKQVSARDGASARVLRADGRQQLSIVLPGDRKQHRVDIRPPIGRWDLRRCTEVRVKLRNTGPAPVTARLQVTNDEWHGTHPVELDTPLKPGQATTVPILFSAGPTWEGPEGDVLKAHQRGRKGTGSEFSSNKADAIRLIVEHEEAAELTVEEVSATVTTAQTPGWLGKRPPVEGDWVLTFDDPFDGTTVDESKWNVHGPNWWGASKLTHWSKDNVIVGDGLARIHFEKKRGWHNDDPATKHESPYAGGYLDTYGKWRQCYGYFEARLKLPQAPGLWPAFWLMPDRGGEDEPQWKRQDTARGGMEFDIMEHLTRWGPNRYNIAMHWDGYDKGHKSLGSQNIHVQPDADGFLTSGLLWLPGKAVFYCNGRELGRWENARIGSVPSVMMFTMPVGGWDNDQLDDSALPADFTIDYVRAWQRKDLVVPASPGKDR